jgi:hypothetical protein
MASTQVHMDKPQVGVYPIGTRDIGIRWWLSIESGDLRDRLAIAVPDAETLERVGEQITRMARAAREQFSAAPETAPSAACDAPQEVVA